MPVGPVTMDKARSVSLQNAHYTNGKRIYKYGLNYTVSFEDISSIREVLHYVNTRDISLQKSKNYSCALTMAANQLIP